MRHLIRVALIFLGLPLTSSIFLAQIIPPDDATKNAKIDAINSGPVFLTSSLDQAQSRIILVDHNTGCNIASYTYDGVHPNETGEEKMAQKWFNAFEAFFSFSNEPPEITGQQILSVKEDHTLTLALSDFTIGDPDTGPGDMTLTVYGGIHYAFSQQLFQVQY